MPRPQLIDLTPPFFRVIPIFTRVLERRKTKKVATADDFSLLVAGTDYPPFHFGWTSKRGINKEKHRPLRVPTFCIPIRF
jgi:hypothetical protein